MTHPVDPCADPAGQDRLSDGGQRQGDHLSRARRAVEPGRASVSFARSEGRRSHRVPDGKPAGLHGDLLGRAAQRALLHRDQPLPYPGRDRLYRQGLRRARRHHLAEMRRPDQGADHGRSPTHRCSLWSTSRSPGFRSWDREMAQQPTTPIADEVAGYDMLYSSGTTGRPKGIKRASEHNPIDLPNPFLKILCADMCGMNADSIYLSPAPLYHAAPSALQHDGDHARRHLDHHGIVRRRAIPGAGRKAQDHPIATGADHVRADAEAAGRCALALRRLLAEGRDPCRRPLPDRRQGQDDRMVGTDPDRILRRLRRQRRHGVDLAAMAVAPRHGRPRRGRQGQDPRRERSGIA